ncbi:MAG: gliding motility-associated C-terminal domain-containing protein [Bacteroidetes bacterium]|nr:gliding motility-associated C-terminal domain-containing protein [Bacteroidota bacterium]
MFKYFFTSNPSEHPRSTNYLVIAIVLIQIFLWLVFIGYSFSQCSSGNGYEMIFNGNFSSGNFGFTTDYSYCNTSGCLGPEGYYTVDDDPAVYNGWSGEGHTFPGPDSFMIVNGAPVANQLVWCQTISVTANTWYIFSTWVSTMDPSAYSPAELQFSINGIPVGSIFTAGTAQNVWWQFYENWYSGAATSAQICIVNQNTASGSNDFGLDDISFQGCECNLMVNAGNDTSICSGESLQLTANGGVTYLWSSGETTASITKSPANDTLFYVIASAGPCSDTDSVFVTINPSFDATINPAGPFCSNTPPIDLIAADTGGIWSGTGITNTVTGTFDPSVSGSGTHKIYYIIPGLCGGADSVSITINPSLDAAIAPAGPLCADDPPLNLSASNSGGLWVGTGITNPFNGTFSPAVSGPGTFQIYYFLTGTCGDTDSVSIIVTGYLDATITPPGSLCQNGSPVLLTAADTGGVWSGTGIVNQDSGIFDPSFSGTGNFVIIYTIPGSCGDTDSVSITVNTSSDATITPAGPFCENETPVMLSATDSIGVWSGNGITNSSTGAFDPSAAGPGTSLITYTISGQCGDSDTVYITVYATPLPVITANEPLSFCDGDTVILTSSLFDSYLWSTNEISQSISVIVSGIYSVTVIDSNNCSGTSQPVSVTVTNQPVAVITGKNSICNGMNIILTASGGSGYVWSTGETSQSVTVIPDDNAQYFVTVSNGSCTDTASISVTVNPLPAAFSGNDTVIEFGSTVMINASGGIYYLWSNGSTDSGMSVKLYSTAVFSVTVTDENNCTSVDSVKITVLECPEPFIPSAFSPNGDNFNDVLFIRGISDECFSEMRFHIYNRWGEEVFQTATVNTGWDGSKNNRALDAGVFVYFLSMKYPVGEEKTMKGNITLVR